MLNDDQRPKSQGMRLQATRKLTLLSRRAFAKKYNFNISSYQAWEEGRYQKGINEQHAKQLSSAFYEESIIMSAEWLLHGNAQPPQRKNESILFLPNKKNDIIDQKAEAYKAIRELNNAVVQAITTNNITKVQQLISKGANLHQLKKKELYLYNAKENTALHIAAEHAGSELIKKLIALDINVNIRNRYGESPLHFSAYSNNEKALTTLLSLSANIEASNTEGTTPLMWAAIAGSEQACTILIEHNAIINNTDFTGNTALHWAAYNDQCHCIKVLAQHSAKITLKNHENKTAMDIAIQNGHKQSALLLFNLAAAEIL